MHDTARPGQKKKSKQGVLMIASGVLASKLFFSVLASPWQEGIYTYTRKKSEVNIFFREKNRLDRRRQFNYS